MEEAIDDLQSHYRTFEVLLLSKPHPPLDRATFAYMIQLIDDPDADSHHDINMAATVVYDAMHGGGTFWPISEVVRDLI